MYRLMILILLVFFFSGNLWAKEKGIVKLGGLRYVLSGAKYSLENKTTDSSETGSSQLIGTTYQAEFVIYSRFGLGLGYGTLVREHELEPTEGKTSVTESVSILMIDLKTYMSSHINNGFKPYVGVSTGTFTASSDLTGGVEGTTGMAVPVTVLSIGADLIFNAGGFRAEYGLSSGKKTDTDSLDSYNASYNFSGSTLNLGVFLFF